MYLDNPYINQMWSKRDPYNGLQNEQRPLFLRDKGRLLQKTRGGIDGVYNGDLKEENLFSHFLDGSKEYATTHLLSSFRDYS